MSVINRIEIGNYLNLDNRRPSEHQWDPHWRYVQINARGKSTAVVATNGIGKSTITKALYAILTRDRTFVRESRERAAPKRRGLWSHVRIEALYQDISEIIQPGMIGDQVPGEAYVIGFYGFSDEIHFYHYLGRFEECPIVNADGHLKRMIPNAEFVAKLKSCARVACDLPVTDWNRFIHRHFDPSLLHQLVNYQKAGGGDGAENFFKVQRRTGEDYDSAFFYTHVAPEILVNCMDVFGEEGEYRFEDTLLESARPVLAAQRKAEERAAAVKLAQAVFDSLEVVKEKADAYRATHEDLLRTTATSSTEVAFIRKIVEQEPTVGIPQPLRTLSPEIAFVADRMVCFEGAWLLPDKAIAEIFESEAKQVNQKALEQQLPSIALKTAQLVESPTSQGSVARPQNGGPPNRGYSCEAALALVENQQKFSDSWDIRRAKRAITDAFDWRTTKGEPNPLRAEANQLSYKQTQIKTGIEARTLRKVECVSEQARIQDQLQNMQAAETALSDMRQSGLFTAQELAEPLVTETKVFAEQDQAIEARLTHQLAHATFNESREAHGAVRDEFPDRRPEDVRQELIQLDSDASSLHLQVKRELTQAISAFAQAQTASEAASQELTNARANHRTVEALIPKVRRFESLFPGESAVGLRTFVLDELCAAKTQHEGLTQKIDHLMVEEQGLTALLEEVGFYHSRFNDELPHAVASTVGRDLDAARSLEKDLAKTLQATQLQHQALEKGSQALAEAQQRFGYDADISLLERALADEAVQWTVEKNSVIAEIASLEPLARGADAFESKFSSLKNAYATSASRLKRLPQCGRQLDYQTKKLDDLERQYAELGKARTAAGSLAQEVLNCVGEVLPRVYEIIETLSIPPRRREEVLVHFSQVLHAPVAGDLESARVALNALDTAGLEAPVFFEPELIRFCLEGDLIKADELSYSFMVGATTLQVRALINPAEIENLKASLETQIAALLPRVKELKDEYADLSPQSETSHLVRLACEAFDRKVRTAMPAARERLEMANGRLAVLEKDRAPDVILTIREATGFLLAGGAEALVTVEHKLKGLIRDVEAVRERLPRLVLRASDESLQWIGAACRFTDKGGSVRLATVKSNKAKQEAELLELDTKMPLLENRVGHIPTIEAAEEFMNAGGWEWASSVELNLEDATRLSVDLKTRLKESTLLRDSLTDRVSQLQDDAHAASFYLLTWEKTLRKAQEYLDKGGPAFDANYEQRCQDLERAELSSSRRTRFGFKHAQQAVDDARVPNNRTRLVNRRDELTRELAELEQDNADAMALHENQASRIQELQRLASRMDLSVVGILRQWRLVRDLLAEGFYAEDTPAAVVESAYLQSAKALHSDLIEQVAIGDLNALAELFDGLADDISNFPLHQQITQLKTLRNDLDRQLAELTRELDRVKRNHQSQLSLTELETLSTDRRPQAMLKDADKLYRHFENYLLSMERLHGQSELDLQEARGRLIESISGFTDSLAENFKLLKQVLDRRDTGGVAGLHIAGELIDQSAVSGEIAAVIQELDLQQRRRDEDKLAGKTVNSDADFEEKLKQDIRATFYRSIFRAPADSDATGPTVTFQHPEIAAGRPERLTPRLSTGQGNALALLILTKLADFTLHRDALADAGSIDSRRRIKPSATRVVMIDGLFSNLSNKKMIRHSLSVLRTLKGSFQLIGWIHNELYENDPDLFPSYCALRRVGGERGFILVDESGSQNDSEMFHEGEIKALELHMDQLQE
ncbi:hypothetical protein EQ845_04875 [Pseudomonas putida]|uniref:hypothetical protein n=1 Tax=Pseudomonas putida TaxID=303 RepID=UPI00117AEA32|nr:hypothetical protein [Pseudomonas putida]TRO37826.1 hypothetical protein EQ845_04875 [Pseudomonas putida]